MNEKEFVETAKRALPSGVTVPQLAIMHGITEQRVYATLHNHGYSVSELRNKTAPTRKQVTQRKRYLQQKQNERRAEVRKQQMSDIKVIKRLKSKLDLIQDKRERFETTYGVAMLTFERRQARENKRPSLPVSASPIM